MTRRSKIASTLLTLLALLVLVVGFTLGHDSPCGDAPAVGGKAARMKAIVHRCYGSSAVLKLEEIEKPRPADNELLVKVVAASVNPADWHVMSGTPYIARMLFGTFRPKSPLLGSDFAGVVEAIGPGVKRFKPGDAVFGDARGTFAEYLTVAEDGAIALKPSNVTLEQAATVSMAGLYALQALRDPGRIHAGQRVLINGASGGIGTFAVQIAKSFGADVTGVTSTRNIELVRSIGADHIVDYTREDFTKGVSRYDLILDNVGNHSLQELRHALNPDGVLIMNGLLGPNDDEWIRPLTPGIKALLISPFVTQKLVTFFLRQPNARDTTIMRDLIGAGKVTPVIDRAYPLSELPTAISYLEQGHARGKVVIRLQP
jgi:NADPH:quinone reductase-like Zn-dependent oxidoreductase